MVHNIFKYCFIFSALFYAPTAFAQDPPAPQEQTLEEQVPARIIHSNKDKIVTLVVENDLLGGKGDDANYTSGIRLSYFDVNADLPDFAYQVGEAIPTFEINETTSVFYSLGQNIYTPRNIEQRAQDPNDRPWAGHLYGSMGLVSITDDHMDEVEVSVGVVGPASLAEQSQKFVHKRITTNSPEPLGWDNQLENEPTLGVGWVRRYPRYTNVDVGGLSLAAAPYFGATIGNVYTFANTGLNLRLTPSDDQWQDAPARVRPAMPGTGFFDIPQDKLSWYLFAGADGRAVGRNIFLDGNSFNNSHSVDKKHFVADLNAGAALTFGSYRASYTLVYRTPEFDGQKDNTVFGALSLGYKF